MLVWLHSKSPPQHIANVHEGTVNTNARLRAFMEETNDRRLVNLKAAGCFENERGEVSCHLFWDVDAFNAYRERNKGKLDLLIGVTPDGDL